MSRFVLIAVGAVVLWMALALPAEAEGNGLAPYSRYAAARERGNAREAAAAFAPWAVWYGTGPCRPTPCVGREAVRREIERRLSQGVRVDVTGVKASDGVVAATVELRWHALELDGVPRLVGTEAVVTDGDSIASLRFRLDTTDGPTARFVATHQPAADWAPGPAGLPTMLRSLVDSVLRRRA
jgi:hypothetical protein